MQSMEPLIAALDTRRYTHAQLTAAVGEAVLNERERCCVAVCFMCQNTVEEFDPTELADGDEWPRGFEKATLRLSGEWVHIDIFEQHSVPCLAAAIRAQGATN
jgi:hypothetical protein